MRKIRDSIKACVATFIAVASGVWAIFVHKSMGAIIALLGLLLAIPGTFLAVKQIKNSGNETVNIEKLTAQVSKPHVCAEPCAIAAFGFDPETQMTKLEDIYVFYQARVLLANESNRPFIIAGVDTVYGSPPSSYMSTGWLHARQGDVAAEVLEHFGVRLGLLSEAEFPQTLNPGAFMQLIVGGQFPATASYVADISGCLESLIAEQVLQEFEFVAPPPSDYRRRYSLLPSECVDKTSSVPSGATEIVREDHISYFYENADSIRNYLAVSGVNGFRDFFRIERSSMAGEFAQFGYGTEMDQPLSEARMRLMR